MLNMHQIIEKSKEFNLKNYLFLTIATIATNYNKIFNCVRWEKNMDDINWNGYVTISYCLKKPESSKAKVRTNTDLTQPFSLEKRIWQGCIPSPLLFNIYDEWIIRKVTGRRYHNRLQKALQFVICWYHMILYSLP